MSRLTRFDGDARDYGQIRPNQDAPPEDTPEWKNLRRHCVSTLTTTASLHSISLLRIIKGRKLATEPR